MQQFSSCCRPTSDVYMCLALLAWLMHDVEVGSPQSAGACIWLLQTAYRIAASVQGVCAGVSVSASAVACCVCTTYPADVV